MWNYKLYFEGGPISALPKPAEEKDDDSETPKTEKTLKPLPALPSQPDQKDTSISKTLVSEGIYKLYESEKL